MPFTWLIEIVHVQVVNLCMTGNPSPGTTGPLTTASAEKVGVVTWT